MLNIGDEVKIVYIETDYFRKIIKKKGTITKIYEHFTLIQFENYLESFRNDDIYNGHYVRIYKKENGEWVRQGEQFKKIIKRKEEEKKPNLRALYPKGKPNAQRPVICLETGIIYSGVNECARQIGAYKQHIVRACKITSRTCKNKHFRYYYEYLKETEGALNDN